MEKRPQVNEDAARYYGEIMNKNDRAAARAFIWKWAKLAFLGFCWGCAGALLLLALGCSSNPTAKEEEVWQRVCYEKPLGQTEDGLLVVLHACLTAEQFQARNRR